MMHQRRVLIVVLLGGLLSGMDARGASSFAEGWRQDILQESRDRIGEVIRDLDSPYLLRRKQVEELVALGRGPNHELVYEQLIVALSYTNPQVREAVVEIMVRMGDSRFTLQLAQVIPYDDMMDIRRLAIRMLPVFCIPGEIQRREAIRMYFTDIRVVTDRFRQLLRSRPLRRGTWEEDVELARIRRRVENTIMEQLDPIDRMLPGLDIKGRRAHTIQLLEELAGTSFGDNTDEARENWRTRRRTFVLRKERLVVETETVAAHTLADIGAFSAAPRLWELGQVDRQSSRSAALSALAELSRFAYELREQSALEIGDRKLLENEQQWRKAEYDASCEAVVTAFALGKELADHAEEIIRIRAYETLGATRWPEAIPFLRSGSIRTGNTTGARACICRALAEIGSSQAVEGLALLANYRGYAMDSQGQREEYQVVLAAIQGLAAIAARASDSGNDAAIKALLGLLAVDRGAPGYPTIQQQTRQVMQQTFGRISKSVNPDDWRKWHLDFLKSGKAIVRPDILRKVPEPVSLDDVDFKELDARVSDAALLKSTEGGAPAAKTPAENVTEKPVEKTTEKSLEKMMEKTAP